MTMLVIFITLFMIGFVLYHILTRTLDWFEFWPCFGYSCLGGVVTWLFICLLGAAMSMPQDHHSVIDYQYVMKSTEYEIVPLCEYDPTYPEGLYLEAYRQNEIDKYKFAYRVDGAIYTKVISQSETILGYCIEGAAPKIEFCDRDFPTEITRFLFIDTICDCYNIRIPFGSIYVRPSGT